MPSMSKVERRLPVGANTGERALVALGAVIIWRLGYRSFAVIPRTVLSLVEPRLSDLNQGLRCNPLLVINAEGPLHESWAKCIPPPRSHEIDAGYPAFGPFNGL